MVIIIGSVTKTDSFTKAEITRDGKVVCQESFRGGRPHEREIGTADPDLPAITARYQEGANTYFRLYPVDGKSLMNEEAAKWYRENGGGEGDFLALAVGGKRFVV